MKKILLLLTVLIPSIAFTQALPIRNDTPTTLRDLGANLNVGRNFAVNQYGQMQCSLNAGVAGATNPIKLEDSVHTTGDAGVFALGVANTSAATLAANGDYIPIATSTSGVVIASLIADAGVNGSSQPIRGEDLNFADGAALMMAGSQAVSAIAQTVSTTGDVAPLTVDLGNRLVTTGAPAGETWYACTGEITTATNTSLKGAVASNRHYVTSFGCAATSTSPNQIYLTDGSGGTAMDLVTTTSNAVAPSVQNTYPVPLRGSSGVALFVTTITTGAVRCCAAGYTSTI